MSERRQMSPFNEYQQAYMRELAKMPASAKCNCGWYPRGDCPNCPPERGGFVRCGATNRRVSDEPCCRKVGHDGDHAGFARVGAGGYSVSWCRQPEDA
jgi:hypothetical protein